MTKNAPSSKPQSASNDNNQNTLGGDHGNNNQQNQDERDLAELVLGSLPSGMALSWGFEKESQRGPKRELSVDQIVRVAVDIADENGLDAVTMARVARHVGVTAMALYRYVAGKDDLLVLMQDAAADKPFPPLSPGDWRGGLRAFVELTIDVFRKHPWLNDIAVAGVPMTPGQLRFVDWALKSMRPLPFNPDEKMSIVLLLTSYGRAWASLERDMQQQAMQAGATPGAVSGFDYGHVLRRLVTAERFPDLHPVVAAGVYTNEADPDPNVSNAFEFGLERILDGIGKYVEDLDPTPDLP